MNKIKLFMLLACGFISVLSYSQKYALLDRAVKQPILYTDSVTATHYVKGYFPVETEQLDSLIIYLRSIKHTILNNRRMKLDEMTTSFGRTRGILRASYAAYGDRYQVILYTRLPNIEVAYEIGRRDRYNKINAKNIQRFIDYIVKDRSLFN